MYYRDNRRRRFNWRRLVVGTFLLGSIFGGCGAIDDYLNGSNNPMSPLPQQNNTMQELNATQKQLRSLLGLFVGRKWEYEGEGNEFAAFKAEVLYSAGNRFQIMEDNGGTVLARIIELRDDGAYEIDTRGEQYERKNLLSDKALDTRDQTKDAKIIPWPLNTNQKWLFADGSSVRLVDTNLRHTVPAGTFANVVQVESSRSNGPDVPASIVDRYYASETGLIERTFHEGDTAVSSRLAHSSGP